MKAKKSAKAKTATAKKKAKSPNKWEQLSTLIQEYADAQEADSWKGGGDPDAIPVVEAQLQLARARLNAHIWTMQRELE